MAAGGTEQAELKAVVEELDEETIGEASQGWTDAVFTERTVKRAAGVMAGFFVGVTGMPLRGLDVTVQSDSDFGLAYNISVVAGLIVYGVVALIRALRK